MIQPNRVEVHPTLLLIDDCLEQRDLYELALAPDFNIVTAARGDDGIQIAARTRPDAIVLDVMMPGLNGWETCTRLKCEPETADVPIVLLTGATDADLSDHAVAVGAFAVLNKPCSADRLKNVVRMALDIAVPDQAANRNSPRVVPIR
jgi:CheY-like chemotaxis protein